LGETITFPLIIFFVFGHKGCSQMSFCLWIPKLGFSKISKLGLLQLLRSISFRTDFQLRWGLKKICNFCWELSNDMWHVTCTQVNQGDFRFLVVESQIDTLIFDPSFDHNLCFNYSNVTCKLILNIHISRAFQWYKELFNPMNLTFEIVF